MADYSDYKECTDCVHYELCLHQEKFLIEHNRKDLIRRYGFGLSEPEICCNFRDRSRFVELPYKLGDVVYVIFERKVIGCVVRRISFDNTKFGANITLDSLDDNNYGTIYGLLADDDCEIFLTREEAEQALKEREDNAK